MPALEITSEISSVETATNWIEEIARIYVDRTRIHDIQIACAEALNNIILHAYRRQAGMPITIAFNVALDHIALVFRDRGSELPATAPPDESRRGFEPGDLAALPESGAGMRLMNACADKVQYRRIGTWNEMILTFFERGTPPPGGHTQPASKGL